jgi:hypothetical protein
MIIYFLFFSIIGSFHYLDGSENFRNCLYIHNSEKQLPESMKKDKTKNLIKQIIKQDEQNLWYFSQDKKKNYSLIRNLYLGVFFTSKNTNQILSYIIFKKKVNPKRNYENPLFEIITTGKFEKTYTNFDLNFLNLQMLGTLTKRNFIEKNTESFCKKDKKNDGRYISIFNVLRY